MDEERKLESNKEGASAAIRKLFELRYPISKENTSSFWQEVLDNTISTEELMRVINVNMMVGRLSSQTFKASVDLLELRTSGVVPFPSPETSEGARG